MATSIDDYGSATSLKAQDAGPADKLPDAGQDALLAGASADMASAKGLPVGNGKAVDGADLAGPADILSGLSDMTLEHMQHWTRLFGYAQQMVLERAATLAQDGTSSMARIAEIQVETAQKGMQMWQQSLSADPALPTVDAGALADRVRGDPRFADPEWLSNPVYSLMLQSYLLASDALLNMTEGAEGIDPRQQRQLRLATRNIIEAASPSNFPMTNPAVVRRTIESNGANLLKGIERMQADLQRGQISHTDSNDFTVGGNIATTPGKVVFETPLFQLIQYSPTTKQVREIPLLIFPPWINRFYILDLGPEKSFVRWAVDQGLTVFMVSWKSADASLADISWDDYVLRGQVLAIDTVRDLLGVDSVHAIGYCVAGTTLAATLAWLAVQGREDIIKSATFFTAQVDFEEAGELLAFVDDKQIETVERLTTDGFLDGRFLALTFNMLRGRDLIWSYVVNNYLMGEDYKPFDLLFWNGDTTNLPSQWLRRYLENCYRDNLLVQPGALSIDGTPIDLRRITVPAYIQAGVEDHIAPACSVWKAMNHFAGPCRFLLAGSGHIAGVVNPPAKQKYQYWTCSDPVESLDEFRARAVETKGSWWPDWIEWIDTLAPDMVPATKARKPGKGKLPAIEDAPGRYVKMR